MPYSSYPTRVDGVDANHASDVNGPNAALGQFTTGVYHALEPSNGGAADPTGVTDSSAALAGKDAAATSGGTLLGAGTYRLSASVTFAHAVRFLPGAKLSLDSGVVVTFNGPLVAPAQQLFSGAGTVAFGPKALKRRVTAEWFGALGDGVTDDSAALQAALTAVGNAGGGAVRADAPSYLIAGALSVPEGTHLLAGDPEAPPFWPYKAYAAGFSITPATSYPGTVMLLTGGAGNATGAPAFTLHRAAGLHGLICYYPNQTVTNPPVAYPWTVVMAPGESAASVTDCLLVNPYQGIQAINHDKFLIANVFGEPLLCGIQVDQMYDVSRMHFVHFWDFWARNDSSKTALNTWKFANTTHFQIGRADLIMCTDLFSINCYRSLYLQHTANGDPWMTINGFQCDAAVYPIYLEGTNDQGVMLSNAELSAYLLGGAGGTTPPVCIYVPDSATPNYARLKIMGGILTNPTSSATGNNLVYLGAAGTGVNRLELQNCDFTSVPQPTGSAAILQKSNTWNVQVDGGTADQYKGQYFWDVSALPTNTSGQRRVSGTKFGAAPVIHDPNTAGIHWSAVEDGTKPGARYGNMRRYDSNGFQTAKTIDRTTTSGGWEQFQGSAEVVSTAATTIPFYRLTNSNIAGMPDNRAFLELGSDNCMRQRLLGLSGLATGVTRAYGFTDGSDGGGNGDMVYVTRDGALVGRGAAWAYAAKTAAYALDVAKDYQLDADATAGAVAITLPAASSVPAGRRYLVMKIDASANAVNVTPSGTDTINGVNAAKALTAQWQSAELWTNGSNAWRARTTNG